MNFYLLFFIIFLKNVYTNNKKSHLIVQNNKSKIKKLNNANESCKNNIKQSLLENKSLKEAKLLNLENLNLNLNLTLDDEFNKKTTENIKINKIHKEEKKIEYPIWINDNSLLNIDKNKIENKLNSIISEIFNFGFDLTINKIVENKKNNNNFYYFLINDLKQIVFNTLENEKNWNNINNNDLLKLNLNDIDYNGKWIFLPDSNSKDLYCSYIKKISINRSSFYIGIKFLCEDKNLYIKYISSKFKDFIKKHGIEKLKEKINSGWLDINSLFNFENGFYYMIVDKNNINDNADLLKRIGYTKDLIDAIVRNGFYTKNIKYEINNFECILYGEKIDQNDNNHILFIYTMNNPDSKDILNYLNNIFEKMNLNSPDNKTDFFLKNIHFLNEENNKFMPIVLFKNNELIFGNPIAEKYKDLILNYANKNENFISTSNYFENDFFEIVLTKSLIDNDIYIIATPVYPFVKYYKAKSILNSIKGYLTKNILDHIFLNSYQIIAHKWLNLKIYNENQIVLYSTNNNDIWKIRKNNFIRRKKSKNFNNSIQDKICFDNNNIYYQKLFLAAYF